MNKTGRAKYYLAASVALTTLVIYLPTLGNGFVNWDDDIYVYDNRQIQSFNGTFFRWAFLDFHVSNWHPLTWISHAVDYALWGLNPMGHHLTSIILHAANSALVVLLALKLLEIVKDRSAPNVPALFLSGRAMLIATGVTGLLFGLHPVHVESVAWVADRKDLLCALFYLLSIMAYMKYATRTAFKQDIEDHHRGTETQTESNAQISNSPFSVSLRLCGPFFLNKHYLSALGLFTLALLSKPMAVTLPAVLMILDWYPLGRVRSSKTLTIAIAEKLPYIALSLVSSVLTILAQRAEGAMAAMAVVPLSTRTLVAAKSLISYLRNMLLPLNLLPFYPYPRDVHLFSLEYLLAIVLIIGITIACIVLAKKQRVWLAVWGYYVVTLIPVLGIVQVGGQAMADRYTYLPSLGPFLIIGLMVAAVSEKGILTRRGWLVVVDSAAVLVILVSLASLTVKQIDIWKTGIDLWNAIIKKEPDKVPLAYYNRGQIFMNTGHFDKAIEDYSIAIRLNPSYQEAFYNRAFAFEKSGQPGLAIEDYKRAISINPSNYQACNNLGILYGASGSYDRAIEYFTRSLAINPAYPDPYFNRGITYSLMGRNDSALEDFSKAIGLNPRYGPAYLNRGSLFFRMNRKDLARTDFRKACELGIREACSAFP